MHPPSSSATVLNALQRRKTLAALNCKKYVTHHVEGLEVHGCLRQDDAARMVYQRQDLASWKWGDRDMGKWAYGETGSRNSSSQRISGVMNTESHGKWGSASNLQ